MLRNVGGLIRFVLHCAQWLQVYELHNYRWMSSEASSLLKEKPRHFKTSVTYQKGTYKYTSSFGVSLSPHPAAFLPTWLQVEREPESLRVDIHVGASLALYSSQLTGERQRGRGLGPLRCNTLPLAQEWDLCFVWTGVHSYGFWAGHSFMVVLGIVKQWPRDTDCLFMGRHSKCKKTLAPRITWQDMYGSLSIITDL